MRVMKYLLLFVIITMCGICPNCEILFPNSAKRLEAVVTLLERCKMKFRRKLIKGFR